MIQHRLLTWLTALVLPFLLLMTSIRILLTPLYLHLEYRRPGFPADPYGFTLQDRLQWASISLEYLLNDSDLSFLSEKTLPDGSPLYNPRELSHMLDVKLVVKGMLTAWYVLLPLFVILGVWAWKGNGWDAFLQGVRHGGWLTAALILLILISVLVSFNMLFTGFHRIFFEGDSWIFQYSDTLIRLFPLQFWQDAFTLAGLLSLLGALLLIFLARQSKS
ncbi:MAG: TIGR01906 family membrane protein [Anaerolineae bacterium]|nr:TIGR01906 family membrane protein [Anaerolineae bacterium]